MSSSKYPRIIMHIDVNSAFLSWQAVYNLQKGDAVDLREIPSVVGGSREARNGIVLAKSTPAKAYGIQTGEVLWQARQKCPNLVSVPPNYELYMKCSNALYELVKEYSPKIQRFSIDEVFLDYTGMEKHFGEPVEAAHMIKDRIKHELGFTVNVGIGCNKLTAKVAGDLKKPDMVHTIYPHEIPQKMWTLPVEDLFMVGRQTKKKLYLLNIHTIGQLANTDCKLLNYKLKSFGTVIWCYANGIDESPVQSGYFLQMKGIGNSTTIRFDVTDTYFPLQNLLP
ncbi:MAG: nucleotidyltransferase/DNA polymerase involved in repair [Clostridia bacterium]|nr:nucleotidyltransferase/DNA polymerase involved in repair [Clostridia bacterium]